MEGQQARAEQLSDVEPRPDHGRLGTGRGDALLPQPVVRNTEHVVGSLFYLPEGRPLLL